MKKKRSEYWVMDIANDIKGKEAQILMKYEIVPWVGFFRAGEIPAAKNFTFPLK